MEGNPEENNDKGQEQDGHADARVQEKKGHNNRQTETCNCLDCLKQLANWLVSPIVLLYRWLYRLQPIEKFTGVLCIVAGFQCWVFIASERPFVSVSQIMIAGGELKADVPLAFIEAVKNSGKTTAFVVDSRNIVRTQAYVPVDRGLRKYMAKTTAKGPVVAGDTNSIISRPVNEKGQPVIFAQRPVDQITNGEQHLWVIGYITYKDLFPVFWTTSTTGYCFLYNPKPADSRLGNFDRCGDEEYEYAH
jgi:hypothetical protein